MTTDKVSFETVTSVFLNNVFYSPGLTLPDDTDKAAIDALLAGGNVAPVLAPASEAKAEPKAKPRAEPKSE